MPPGACATSPIGSGITTIRPSHALCRSESSLRNASEPKPSQRQLRSESEDLEICWNLALRFKHFELARESQARGVLDTDQVYVSASSAHISDPPDEPVDYSVGGSATISGLSLWTLHPKVTHDGERKRLVDVYGRAYQFLDRLLKKHGL